MQKRTLGIGSLEAEPGILELPPANHLRRSIAPCANADRYPNGSVAENILGSFDSLSMNGGRVSWLVETDLVAAGQPQLGYEPPTAVRNRHRRHNTALSQFGGHGVDVVAHEIQFVFGLAVGRMDGKLERRAGEDRPATARGDGRELQHLAQERADAIDVPAVENCMDASDHS
jgi:hypothetical protein